MHSSVRLIPLAALAIAISAFNYSAYAVPIDAASAINGGVEGGLDVFGDLNAMKREPQFSGLLGSLGGLSGGLGGLGLPGNPGLGAPASPASSIPATVAPRQLFPPFGFPPFGFPPFEAPNVGAVSNPQATPVVAAGVQHTTTTNTPKPVTSASGASHSTKIPQGASAVAQPATSSGVSANNGNSNLGVGVTGGSRNGNAAVNGGGGIGNSGRA